MPTYLRSLSTALLFGCLLFGQSSSAEDFDLTGLPAQPTNYAERRIVEMVERHQPGDVRDAAFIQQQLAAYYRQKGDAARAQVADERARSAQPAGASTGPQASVAGEYVCRSMGSRPCDTQTTISLHADGTWGWRYFSGQYRVAGDQVTFQGAGLGAWGPATIGSGTFTFAAAAKKSFTRNHLRRRRRWLGLTFAPPRREAARQDWRSRFDRMARGPGAPNTALMPSWEAR